MNEKMQEFFINTTQKRDFDIVEQKTLKKKKQVELFTTTLYDPPWHSIHTSFIISDPVSSSLLAFIPPTYTQP